MLKNIKECSFCKIRGISSMLVKIFTSLINGMILPTAFLEAGKGNCNLEQLLQTIAPVELEAIILESRTD